MSYGCFNRKPLADILQVQDGNLSTWRLVTEPVRITMLKWIPVPMTKDCQYTKSNPADPGCTGCRWQAT